MTLTLASPRSVSYKGINFEESAVIVHHEVVEEGESSSTRRKSMFEPWVFAAKGQERPHGTPAEVFEAEEEAAAAAHRSNFEIGSVTALTLILSFESNTLLAAPIPTQLGQYRSDNSRASATHNHRAN